MKKFDLISFATAEELASQAAGAWLDEIESADRAGHGHLVALSGGRIAQKLFTSTVEQAKARKNLLWPVHFFWADERCVPPTDPESNFKLANELLLTPLKISKNRIHRIWGEDPPETAAKIASAAIRSAAFVNANGQPVLDLVLLGMGEDGHVASLFPDATAEIVNHPGPFLFIDNSPKPPPRRISLSYAAIAAARQVWVLISCAGKEEALRESLDFSGKTPLAKVIELRQNTLIFSQIEAGKII